MAPTGWLQSLDLGRYAGAFRENEIDETVLPHLTPSIYRLGNQAPCPEVGDSLRRSLRFAHFEQHRCLNAQRPAGPISIASPRVTGGSLARALATRGGFLWGGEAASRLSMCQF
jgi:hypothetical protein